MVSLSIIFDMILFVVIKATILQSFIFMVNILLLLSRLISDEFIITFLVSRFARFVILLAGESIISFVYVLDHTLDCRIILRNVVVFEDFLIVFGFIIIYIPFIFFLLPLLPINSAICMFVQDFEVLFPINSLSTIIFS